MFDQLQLINLTNSLKRAVLDEDVVAVIDICIRHDDFIFSLIPKNQEDVDSLKVFFSVHQQALLLIETQRNELETSLNQSKTNRKKLTKYIGVSGNE